MRVLIVNAHGADLAAGGSERYVADLVAGLGRRGHEVHVLSAFPVREDGAPSTTVLHDTHWRESRSRRWRNHLGDLVSTPRHSVRDLVVAARPDLVHTCNLPGISSSVWETSRRLGLPLVHTLLDYHLVCARSSLTRRDGTPCCAHSAYCRVRRGRLARWAGAVTHVVSGSEHLWDRVGSTFPHATLRIVRVPIVPVSSTPLRPPSAPPRVISFLGGLDRVKGVEELLQAATPLSSLGLELRLAGDGRLREAVEAAAGESLAYDGLVTGSARVAFFETADIAVVPSTYEEPWGPPYVVAEWLAAGRPVLCSTRGGLAEAAGLPGVVAIEPTPEGIVAGARRALDEWRALSGLAPVTGTEDLERWLDEHEDVYERAAAARRSSTSA